MHRSASGGQDSRRLHHSIPHPGHRRGVVFHGSNGGRTVRSLLSVGLSLPSESSDHREGGQGFLGLRALRGGGSRTRAASVRWRTHSEVRAEEGTCSRRFSRRPTRRPRIGAHRRPQVTPAIASSRDEPYPAAASCVARSAADLTVRMITALPT